MTTKPVLFWPRPQSDIERYLGRDANDFLLVDTNNAYEMQKLYKIKPTTPIFDPFPQSGKHYQEFRNHVSDVGTHIVGVQNCRTVLRALNDPSLAHSSIDELLAAIAPAGSNTGLANRLRVLLPRWLERSTRISVDWSRLNWPNTILLAVLVFVAALIGNMLFFDNSLIAAAVATLAFIALYVCVRINAAGSHATDQPTGARRGLNL